MADFGSKRKGVGHKGALDPSRKGAGYRGALELGSKGHRGSVRHKKGNLLCELPLIQGTSWGVLISEVGFMRNFWGRVLLKEEVIRVVVLKIPHQRVIYILCGYLSATSSHFGPPQNGFRPPQSGFPPGSRENPAWVAT